MEVVTEPAPAISGSELALRRFSLNEISFVATCVVETLFCSLTTPIFTVLARECWGTFCAIRESYRKEEGLTEFRFNVGERDFLSAQENYLRHTSIGALPGHPNKEQTLIEIWKEEASRALRTFELRGRIEHHEIADYFPECIYSGDRWEDVCLVLRELHSLRHCIFAQSEKQKLLDDLSSNDSGRQTLEIMREMPLDQLSSYYSSLSNT